MFIITTHRMAGFGSIFMQALDWLWYGEHTNTPVYISWERNGINMADTFFTQRQSKPLGPGVVTVNTYYHDTPFSSSEEDFRRDAEIEIYTKYKQTSCFLCCNPYVYREPSFPKFRTLMRQVIDRNLIWKPDGGGLTIPENTLGVHCRHRDHFTLNGHSQLYSKTISIEEFYKQNIEDIQREFEIGNYDYIYIACHMKPYFDRVVSAFKDKALFLNFDRYQDDIVDPNDCSFHGYSWAVRDKINLSKCKYLIGNCSNFTMVTLILNPDMPFKLFDTVKDCYGL